MRPSSTKPTNHDIDGITDLISIEHLPDKMSDRHGEDDRDKTTVTAIREPSEYDAEIAQRALE
jgi:hypothetical protein